MGLYEVVADERGSPGLPWVAEAKSYTLYERNGGLWYVNFVAGGRQIRLSTGCRDRESAKALIESLRGKHGDSPHVRVNDKHLYRMIERARTRAKKKNIPVELSIALMRELIERCRGYCEVSGHHLEDAGPFRPSLDRIDCSKGYVPGNVRIVCLIANTAMLHFGESALAELAITYCRHRKLFEKPEPVTD